MYSLTEKCGVHLSLTPLREDFVEPVIVLIRAEALLRGAPIVGFQPIRDFSKARPADYFIGEVAIKSGKLATVVDAC